MKVLIIFRIYFFIFSFCLYSSVFSQNKDNTNNNLTQDWIFGDGPEPKWVIELLHGAYQNVKEDNSCLLYTSPSPRDVEESRMPSSA